MTDKEMVQVGTNINNEPVFNVKYKDGGLVSTTIFTEAEAKAIIEEVVEDTKPTDEELEATAFEGVPDYKSMTKLELESLMREHGVELDRRSSKGDLLKQVNEYFEQNFS